MSSSHSNSNVKYTLEKSVLIFERLYLHYYAIIIISVEKWSQNDNIIIYRNNFWDNLSPSKVCYHDRPKYDP